MIYARFSTLPVDQDGTCIWEEIEHVYGVSLPTPANGPGGASRDRHAQPPHDHSPAVIVVYASGW